MQITVRLRLGRAEVFAPDEIATVHVMNRVVRRCFLLGSDSFSAKNYDHRKDWIEDELERVASYFGIDCLNFAIAGAAYVDLNPIRAAIAETLETSNHTSVQRRIEALRASLALVTQAGGPGEGQQPLADAFLAPLEIDERRDELGPRPSISGQRASDKGFLALPVAAYVELLDWTARRLAPGKSGSTPETAPPILERLQIRPEIWCELISGFGRLFSVVIGKPQNVDNYRRPGRRRRFHMRRAARELLPS